MHAYGEGIYASFVVGIVCPLILLLLGLWVYGALRFRRNRIACAQSAICPNCGHAFRDSQVLECMACGEKCKRVLRVSRWHGALCMLLVCPHFLLFTLAASLIIAFVDSFYFDKIVANYWLDGIPVATIVLAAFASLTLYRALRWKYVRLDPAEQVPSET